MGLLIVQFTILPGHLNTHICLYIVICLGLDFRLLKYVHSFSLSVAIASRGIIALLAVS